MDSCTSTFNLKSKRKWIYFLRQLMICSGVWSTFFMAGQLVGAPTVFIPQMRRDEGSKLGDEMASWLYSVFGFAAVPWVIVLPILSKFYGLRLPYIISCVDFVIVYTMFYLSNTPLHLLICEITFGLSYANCLTISVIIVSEYSSPEYRGVFLTIKSASFFWGVWSANAIGTFFNYKYIAYPGFVCIISTITFVFWPESPQWLASQGRFEECKTSFHWLFGNDEESNILLDKLINSQIKSRSSNLNCCNVTNFKTVTRREFYAPFLLSAILVTQYHFSGKFVYAMYAIDIIKKITGSESTAYVGMLILDGVTVFGMYFGCILSKYLKRRTLYLTSSFIAVGFLFILSLYLYLIKLCVIEENKILSIVLLTCFSLALSCGPVIMTTSIFAEIIPLKFKSVIVLTTGLLFYIYNTSLLKLAPSIFKSIGLHGTFLFYGLTCGACTILLYKYLPETKGKSLQEAEEYFKIKNKEECKAFEKTNNLETERLK